VTKSESSPKLFNGDMLRYIYCYTCM